MSRVRRYDPPLGRAAQAFVIVHFVAVLCGATALLWYADQLPFATLAVAALAVLGVLWLIGAVMQGRLAPARAVAAECVGALLLYAGLAAGLLQVG